ncbi:hypothetical protein C2S51_020030 [Perilla frutescens var. frutescens]|nr:hypothetical protein C2S51_020030 [Perilla frutescens var. frutescens]
MENEKKRWESPDTRPSFYKFRQFPHLDQLEIPSHFFNEHLASDGIERVRLRGPCGSGEAKLQRCHGEGNATYIVQGWFDFAKTQCIGKGEFMLFFYNGRMSFDVRIYLPNGCLKKYPQECAPSSHSSFPFFTHQIHKHNVGEKCILKIPIPFARMHLPFCKQTMMLKDSNGISWLINIVATSAGQLVMSAGWKSFADARSLKKGDVCIFELVNQNLMHVRIHRS